MPPLEPATLKYWVYDSGASTAGSFQETIINEFEAAHPGVHIAVTAFPEDNYALKVQTAIAAGAPPDLGLIFGPDMMRQGLVLPLDDMVQAYGIDLSTYSQAIIKGPGDFSCSWEGTLYCLGSEQGAVMMFYNKDMFAAAGIPDPAPWPPMTVDQFIADACQLTNKDAGVWGAAYGTTILPWELAVSPDGRTVTGYINSPDAVHNYDLLAQGIRDGCAPGEDLVDPWEQGADLFAQGKLAMVVTDFESLKTIENAGINYGTTGVPTPPGVEPYFDVWSDNTGVFKDSPYPVQGEAFIAFLTTRGQELQISINGSMPLDSAVAERLDWAQGIPGRLDGLEVLKHGRPPVFIPDKWNAWGPFYDAMSLMTSGEEAAQQALDEAAPKLQQDLDKAWQAWDEGATP
jgi:multiple sugar transport system substrate-binding protein